MQGCLLMSKCIVCDKEVVWEEVVEEFEGLFDRVDAHGEASLTEHQQIVYHGKVCSRECYNNLG